MRSGAVPRAAPVDRLEVRVLVDNSVDMLSTPGPAGESSGPEEGALPLSESQCDLVRK